jgi:hypothetical protein
MLRIKWFFLSGFLLFSFLANNIYSKPAQVILIRHGEKPQVGEHLSLKGEERAAALAPYFMETKDLLIFGHPVAIYATKINGQDKSQRTQETVTPLAKALNLPISADYIAKEYEKAATDILKNPAYEGKMVLVCWEHHRIPLFTQALGVSDSLPKWHGDVFDQLWIVNFLTDGKLTFQIKQQALLFGDTPP